MFEGVLFHAGDMITEEALPTYMSQLNTLEGTRDLTGAEDTAWARWTRQWTAEENRHGDAMNKYMWLTGRWRPVGDVLIYGHRGYCITTAIATS